MTFIAGASKAKATPHELYKKCAELADVTDTTSKSISTTIDDDVGQTNSECRLNVHDVFIGEKTRFSVKTDTLQSFVFFVKPNISRKSDDSPEFDSQTATFTIAESLRKSKSFSTFDASNDPFFCQNQFRDPIENRIVILAFDNGENQ